MGRQALPLPTPNHPLYLPLSLPPFLPPLSLSPSLSISVSLSHHQNPPPRPSPLDFCRGHSPRSERYDTSCRRNTTLHFLHFHNLIIDKLMMKKRVTTRHEFPSADIEFSCCRTDNYSFRRSSIFRYRYLSLIAIESLLS